MTPTFIGTDFVNHSGYASFKLEELARTIDGLHYQQSQMKREISELKRDIEKLKEKKK